MSPLSGRGGSLVHSYWIGNSPRTDCPCSSKFLECPQTKIAGVTTALRVDSPGPCPEGSELTKLAKTPNCWERSLSYLTSNHPLVRLSVPQAVEWFMTQTQVMHDPCCLWLVSYMLVRQSSCYVYLLVEIHAQLSWDERKQCTSQKIQLATERAAAVFKLDRPDRPFRGFLMLHHPKAKTTSRQNDSSRWRLFCGAWWECCISYLLTVEFCW